MKRFPRFSSLLAIGLLTAALLTGCNGESHLPEQTQPDTETVEAATTESSVMSCTVTVVDYAGAPMADVVVTVSKDDEEVKKNVSKADGVVKFTLDKDTYTVSVTSTTGEYDFDTQAAVLSPDATDLTLTLYNKADTAHAVTIWPSNGEKQAVPVNEGATYIELTDVMTYVVFRPERDGVYEVSYISDSNIDLGYYGSPMVVFDTKMLDTVNNKVTLSVHASSINNEGGATAMFVFGLEPETAVDGCIFTVPRTGDLEKTPADEP